MEEPTHAFDFWLGEWEVHDAEGRHVGRNSVTAPYDTGAVAEHWESDSGVVGHSLNAWDAERGCWHQTWIDSTGGILLLDGGVRHGAMVLEARTEVRAQRASKGIDADARQRITWTEHDAGVRQLWETSRDDGETWVTAFDGRYSRAVTSAPSSA